MLLIDGVMYVWSREVVDVLSCELVYLCICEVI